MLSTLVMPTSVTDGWGAGWPRPAVTIAPTAELWTSSMSVAMSDGCSATVPPWNSWPRGLKWRWIVGSVVVSLVLLGLAASSTLGARSHASRALRDFQYVQNHLSGAATKSGRTDLESHLKAALSESQSAKSSLTSTGVLGVTQWIPYFGGEIKGASTLFDDASSAAAGGLDILQALDTFQASDASGDISNASLVKLQRKVAKATSTIALLERDRKSTRLN